MHSHIELIAKLKLIAVVLSAGYLLNGCTVLTVAGAVVGTTVGVGAAVIGTTVDVGSAVVGTTVDVAQAGVKAVTGTSDASTSK